MKKGIKVSKNMESELRIQPQKDEPIDYLHQDKANRYGKPRSRLFGRQNTKFIMRLVSIL